MTDDPRYPVGRFIPPPAFDLRSTRAAIAALGDLPDRVTAAVSGLDEAQLDTPYREGGWTVRQVVHHLADSHLNAYLRTRLALTEEAPTVRPYDEKGWAELPDAKSLPVTASLQLLEGLHVRWVALLGAVAEADWQRTMIHPEFKEPIALWWLVAMYDWHGAHHLAHVTRLRAREEW